MGGLIDKPAIRKEDAMDDLLKEGMDETSRERKLEIKDRLLLALIILLTILLFGGVLSCMYSLNHQKTAILSSVDESVMHDTSDGQIRIRIGSYVTIENDTMQNLNFENANENRLMRCLIRLADEDSYCYMSQYIEAGDMITADVIETKDMEAGENEALAELYTYDPETKEQIGQVNVKLVLYLK